MPMTIAAARCGAGRRRRRAGGEEMSHPIAARSAAAPEGGNSISVPATKNSIARPKSASTAMKSSGTTQPSTAGPSRRPSTISNTTSGIANPAPERPNEQRRCDGHRREEHHGADRDVHDAPVRAQGAPTRDANGALSRGGARWERMPRRAFRGRNMTAVSSWHARPAGANHRRTQRQPGHRSRRGGARRVDFLKAYLRTTGADGLRARHQRRAGLHARRTPLPARSRGARCRGRPARFVAVRLPYGVQHDEADAQLGARLHPAAGDRGLQHQARRRRARGGVRRRDRRAAQRLRQGQREGAHADGRAVRPRRRGQRSSSSAPTTRQRPSPASSRSTATAVPTSSRSRGSRSARAGRCSSISARPSACT